jgi:hypothetical protein
MRMNMKEMNKGIGILIEPGHKRSLRFSRKIWIRIFNDLEATSLGRMNRVGPAESGKRYAGVGNSYTRERTFQKRESWTEQ